jgi:hypothetical protein
MRRHGPWRTLEEVELATLSWIDWFGYGGDLKGLLVRV